jgi:hypothetical protein
VEQRPGPQQGELVQLLEGDHAAAEAERGSLRRGGETVQKSPVQVPLNFFAHFLFPSARI